MPAIALIWSSTGVAAILQLSEPAKPTPEPATDQAPIASGDQRSYELVILGDGPAALAAAHEAKRRGVQSLLTVGDPQEVAAQAKFQAQLQVLVETARRVHDARRIAQRWPNAETLKDVHLPLAAVWQSITNARMPQESLRSERAEQWPTALHPGPARFLGPDRIQIGDEAVKFCRAIVAPRRQRQALALPVTSTTDILTPESLFSCSELPRRLAIVGAGATGCELAQALARLGSEVHLIDERPQILSGEDPAAAAIVATQFEREGVHLYLDSACLQAESSPAAKTVLLERKTEGEISDSQTARQRGAGQRQLLIVDAILNTVEPTLFDFDLRDLSAAGIQHDRSGVVVSNKLLTSNPRVFATIAGATWTTAACSDEALGRTAAGNALSIFPRRWTGNSVPRSIQVDPPLAHVGLTPISAREVGTNVDSFAASLPGSTGDAAPWDQPVLAIVHTRRGSDRVLGCTLVGEGAEIGIEILALLIDRRLSLATLQRVLQTGGSIQPNLLAALRLVTEQFVASRGESRWQRLTRRFSRRPRPNR